MQQATPKPMQNSSSNEFSGRFNNFDLLRFVFASLVVFTHSYCICTNVSNEPIHRLSNGQIEASTLAVDGFFIISGYLITKSWEHSKGLIDYVTKRLRRIYPGFIAAIIITIPASGYLGTSDPPNFFRSYRTYTYTYRQFLFRDPILYGTFESSKTPGLPLGSLATLPHELNCYWIVAILGLSGVLRRKRIVLGMFALSLLAYNCYLSAEHHIWGPYIPRLYTYFLAGACFYAYRKHIVLSRAKLALSFLALAATLPAGLSITLPVFGTYLLFHVAYSKSIKLHHFAKFGDLSYGIFIYGYLIQQIVFFKCSSVRNPDLLTFITLPLTYVVAALSWHLVEKRFLRSSPSAIVDEKKNVDNKVELVFASKV